jgi:hypothetical protein
MTNNVLVKDIAAQSSVQNGATHDSKGFAYFTVYTVTSGTITGGVCQLQASPDGTSWATIATRTLSAAGVFADSVAQAHRFLRVSITTVIAGGGTVDLWYCAGGPGLPNDVGFGAA